MPDSPKGPETKEKAVGILYIFKLLIRGTLHSILVKRGESAHSPIRSAGKGVGLFDLDAEVGELRQRSRGE